eukprot:SAG22_NODE_21482_length_256_cov_1.318471_1_plen_39_part_10
MSGAYAFYCEDLKEVSQAIGYRESVAVAATVAVAAGAGA